MDAAMDAALQSFANAEVEYRLAAARAVDQGNVRLFEYNMDMVGFLSSFGTLAAALEISGNDKLRALLDDKDYVRLERVARARERSHAKVVAAVNAKRGVKGKSASADTKVSVADLIDVVFRRPMWDEAEWKEFYAKVTKDLSSNASKDLLAALEKYKIPERCKKE